MPGATPRTGRRAVGEGGHNPKDAVETAEVRYRWSYLPGEPDALKDACPVREGAVGNVPRGNALAAYFISETKGKLFIKASLIISKGRGERPLIRV